MGSWGITMRQNDYGLDLLGTIVAKQLKAVNFTTFNVANTLEIIRADIMEETRKANRNCSAENLVFYISESFPHNFIHGTLLIAERFDDYYLTSEMWIQCPTTIR